MRAREHALTTGVDGLSGQELLLLALGPARLVVHPEAVDDVLEADVAGSGDVEAARGEDVAHGAVEGRQGVHRVRRLEERVRGL